MVIQCYKDHRMWYSNIALMPICICANISHRLTYLIFWFTQTFSYTWTQHTVFLHYEKIDLNHISGASTIWLKHFFICSLKYLNLLCCFIYCFNPKTKVFWHDVYCCAAPPFATSGWQQSPLFASSLRGPLVWWILRI